MSSEDSRVQLIVTGCSVACYHFSFFSGGLGLMSEEEVKEIIRQRRPATMALFDGSNEKDALTLAVDAFVELEPSLGSRRDQVAALLIASVSAFKRERGEYVATAH
jgi:hypothetical protein